MIRINFSFGHLDRPNSTTTWGFDIPTDSDSNRDGENSRSEVEGEALQSGPQASPEHGSPPQANTEQVV